MDVKSEFSDSDSKLTGSLKFGTENCHNFFMDSDLTKKIWFQPYRDPDSYHGFEQIIHIFLQYSDVLVQIEVCFLLRQVRHCLQSYETRFRSMKVPEKESWENKNFIPTVWYVTVCGKNEAPNICILIRIRVVAKSARRQTWGTCSYIYACATLWIVAIKWHIFKQTKV
jgi:hypothetical protein